MEHPIEHDAQRGRFHVTLQGQACVCDYRLRDGVMVMTHTEVPRELEGHGVAAALVRAALEHARASGWQVRPLCSYVQAYMRRHGDTQDLLAR